MAGEFAPVTQYVTKLEAKLTSPEAVRRLKREGIKAATDAAQDVGHRHRLRNWQGRRLDAHEGNDAAELTGPWRLFDEGRKSRGEITPRGRALSTPEGPRAGSHYGPSRGIGVYRDASHAAQAKVPRAVHEEWQGVIRSAT
jgi:hypothetical protein